MSEELKARIVELERQQGLLVDVEKLREAIEDAAYEWALYVEVDTAPRTLQEHMLRAFDAALAAVKPAGQEGGEA